MERGYQSQRKPTEAKKDSESTRIPKINRPRINQLLSRIEQAQLTLLINAQKENQKLDLTTQQIRKSIEGSKNIDSDPKKTGFSVPITLSKAKEIGEKLGIETLLLKNVFLLNQPTINKENKILQEEWPINPINSERIDFMQEMLSDQSVKSYSASGAIPSNPKRYRLQIE